MVKDALSDVQRLFTKNYELGQKLMVEHLVYPMGNFKKSTEIFINIIGDEEGLWSESEAAY